ncbi:hypothetical protein C8Q79DRAFT_230337 [Trametes meyenii]|nr:hypothetical protein C8Q79DRAFT_230337 [Trametes meyenii]
MRRRGSLWSPDRMLSNVLLCILAIIASSRVPLLAIALCLMMCYCPHVSTFQLFPVRLKETIMLCFNAPARSLDIPGPHTDLIRPCIARSTLFTCSVSSARVRNMLGSYHYISDHSACGKASRPLHDREA